MTARTTTTLRLGREGRGRRMVRAVAYGVAFAVPVALLALVVREKTSPLQDLDAAIIRATTDITREQPPLRTVLVAWQEALQPIWLNLVAGAVCLWVWRARGLGSRALWAALTILAGWNLQLDVKLLVQRVRPVVADPVSTAPGYSFPSGHAANTASTTTTLAILVWPLLGPTGRRIVATSTGLVVVLTALDRVFLGVHYPSDVAAGILLGCGIAVASYAGYRGWSPLAHPTTS